MLFHKVKTKFCKYVDSNSLYNALATFLWMCMFQVPFLVSVVTMVCSFLSKKRLRLLIPGIVALFYIPIKMQDALLSGFILFMFVVGIGIMEYRRINSESRKDYNSLILLLFSMVALSITDFTQEAVWRGIRNTYGFGGFPACIYRVFSILLITEFIKGLSVILKRTKLCSFVGFNFLFLVGAVNYWVLAITNKEFVLSDLYLAKTAAGVITGVQITKEDFLIFLIYLGLVLLFNWVLWRVRFEKLTNKERIKQGIKGIVYLVVMVLVIQSGYLRAYTYKGTANMGLVSRLIESAKGIEKPSGYEAFLKEMNVDEKEAWDGAIQKSDGPNIIVVMSEAFSDLQMVADFETNEDYMPYIRNLMEEYPSGMLYSSVLGNNTVSSEYEFLTGIPTGLTDKGGTIYQRYIEDEEASVVSLLEKQGYSTAGVHSYDGVGYNRLHAWESFGFDDVYFKESFENPNYIRDFISDESFYHKIIEIYENKSEQPLFCFGISMQNHATYESGYEGDIRLSDMDYPDVEEYLSLLKETDRATKEFLSYFENVEEDTMVVFFGDHQPMVDTEFYSELIGTDFYEFSLEERARTYQIPYFIWTNYEADFDVPEEMSINYLPNTMLSAAGLEKGSWFGFVDEVFQKYPVVTENFIKVDEEFQEREDVVSILNEIDKPDEESKWDLLKRYQVWSYRKALEK